MTNAYQQAKSLLSEINIENAAVNCDFSLTKVDNKFNLTFIFFTKKILLTFPECKAYLVENNQEVPEFITAIFLYHLSKADGSSIKDEWISYQNLPGGLSYVQAFRNYTSKLLQNHFQNDLKAIKNSAKILGLKKLEIGADAAYEIKVLPKIYVAFLYRLGDEEFEPVADFLFDESASHQLPSDCYTLICSWITKSLIKEKWFM